MRALDTPPSCAVRHNASREQPASKNKRERFLSIREAQDADRTSWMAQNWAELVPRLYIVAIWRLRRTSGATWGAADAEDIVNDAIAKTIGGVRTWAPEKCTLFQHLVGVIVSDISHFASSSESQLRVHKPSNGNAEWPPDVADETPNQEQVEQWRSEQRGLIDHLRRIDPKLATMAELLLLDDETGTEVLGRELDLAPSAVANLRKRMRRAARAYHAENRS